MRIEHVQMGGARQEGGGPKLHGLHKVPVRRRQPPDKGHLTLLEHSPALLPARPPHLLLLVVVREVGKQGLGQGVHLVLADGVNHHEQVLVGLHRVGKLRQDRLLSDWCGRQAEGSKQQQRGSPSASLVPPSMASRVLPEREPKPV